MAKSKLNIRVRPFGPGPKIVEEATQYMLEHPDVQQYIRDTRFELLSFKLLDPEQFRRKKYSRHAPPPKYYQATIVDYTNNRTIIVDGRLDNLDDLQVTESSSQPIPSRGEFDAAVQVLMEQSEEIGQAIHEGEIQPYRPMPPLVGEELPDGRVERTLAVGIQPRSDRFRNEIVGVNMARQNVLSFENNAPLTAIADHDTCGNPHAGQQTQSSEPGQVWVTVRQGRTTLWRFLAVRPSASSGTNGSGIELRYVDYRGKRLLYRAHVPILNVRYHDDACGPYLDWQNEEGMINAIGTNVGSGFRLCPTPATTILDTGSDVGNFLGVAIYVQGLEVVLVCEMQAGWYRYISEWRLHADGTIRPRFGFAAVDSSSCACNRHYHHVYWRFDFDIRTHYNNRVREYNNPPLVGGSNWHDKKYEIRRPRNPARNRKWRVENTVSGEAYDIIPGPDDGVATSSPDWPFPQGDVWLLRYHGSEIDNGVPSTGPPYEANLDSFKNGEAINNHDVVVWYAGHVIHDEEEEPPGTFGHILGPDLKLVSW